MSKVREKIKLTSYDELLKVETTDGLKEIDVDKLHDFSNHPFKVSDDEKMEELTESIRERGVLLPILVRKTNDEEFEIISGHRRTHAARLAGLEGDYTVYPGHGAATTLQREKAYNPFMRE